MDIVKWDELVAAAKHYTQFGFKLRETPWLIDFDVAMVTCPDETNVINTDYDSKALVGSAEQGFLQLMKDDNISLGRYMSIGPCFRNEKVDELHKVAFGKLELFEFADSGESAYYSAKTMLHLAKGYMSNSKIVKTTEGWDLEINDIEVGSYGRRFHPDYGYWAYGTGLASPRYSRAKSHK